MEWTTVISLILVGLLLIVIEVIFIPGTTLVGLAGFLIVVAGLVFSFVYFGSDTGWAILGGTAVLSGVLFYLAFKGNVWSRFALKSSIDSKVNEGDLDQFKEGMEGVAVSTLRPIGNAEIDNKIIEVTTQGEYVPSGSKIRIIKISFNQITVEPLI
jgi:membrane-bound ClpP family serine protease